MLELFVNFFLFAVVDGRPLRDVVVSYDPLILSNPSTVDQTQKAVTDVNGVAVLNSKQGVNKIYGCHAQVCIKKLI